MKELLQRYRDSGYPSEYLLARLRGRSTHFITNWDSIIVSPDPPSFPGSPHFGDYFATHPLDGAWKWALAEYRWVSRQMNDDLWECFVPFFAYLEVQTIIKCLRHKIRGSDGRAIENLLSYSLLSNRIKELMIRVAKISDLLKQFKRGISRDFMIGVPLTDIYTEKGLIGLEQKLAAGVLEEILSIKLHPVLRVFFTYMTDARNIVAAYKRLRWSMTEDSSFINGGSLRAQHLRNVVRDSDLSGLYHITLRIARRPRQSTDADNIENILHAGLYRKTRIMARDGSEHGLLLYHLYSIHVQALNLSLIQYGRGIDRSTMRSHLIV